MVSCSSFNLFAFLSSSNVSLFTALISWRADPTGSDHHQEASHFQDDNPSPEQWRKELSAQQLRLHMCFPSVAATPKFGCLRHKRITFLSEVSCCSWWNFGFNLFSQASLLYPKFTPEALAVLCLAFTRTYSQRTALGYQPTDSIIVSAKRSSIKACPLIICGCPASL